MNLQGTIIQLESWAREELAAQKALAAELERQERAVAGNDTPGLLRSTEEVQRLIQRGAGRDRRRRQLTNELARAFGVAAQTLTLGSIAERAEALGASAQGLRAVRSELREETSRVLRLGRRISAVARRHRGFLDEVLRILAPRENGTDQPVLLDARA